MSVRQLSDARVGNAKSELVAQRDHSEAVLRFFRSHHWMRATRHSSCLSVPWEKTCLRARAQVKAHRWLRRLALSRYERLYAPHPVVSHVAMWLCIHSKEGAWDANTGNGYLGGLQMTPGWGGVSRPDLLSPGAQIALAENQYRASGWSLSWIRQQWPNTSYGCV